MRALILTWEFPPFISGGLGMACYGLIKAMLAQGIEVDLMLPTVEEVYFPMRSKEDADLMPMKFFDPEKQIKSSVHDIVDLRERLKAVGASTYPTSYLTPGFDFKKSVEWIWTRFVHKNMRDVDAWQLFLRGEENLFKKVQEFTAMVLKNAHNLNFDIIHVHDWLTYPAGVMLKALLKKPMVAHMHATEFDRAGGVGDERIHHIEYEGLANADRIIAVSQYTSRMVIERYSIDPNKIRVVHNAHSFVSDDKFKRWRLFKDPLVLFLGRVTLQKGPDYFLETAERVIKRFPKVRFVMAGSGDMFSRILRGAAAKRLKDRFLFSGFLNREQVERILSASDIFVLPSVSEPFGIVPLEAMAAGVATIISKQSGVSEVIDNAFKIDFWDVDKMSDVIVDLLKDPKGRQEIADAGREEVLAIKWKEAATKNINVYKELVCSM